MLKTEMRNPRTYGIERMETAEIVRTINEENRTVADAIDAAIGDIAKATDAIVRTIQSGGRVFYIGAGTSGRLGIIDATECPPTFGVSPDLFTGIIAGGHECVFRAAEGEEDDPERSKQDLDEAGMQAGDTVVGISASGGAAYVISALKHAKEKGATAVSISNNPGSPMAAVAEIAICADTGPEVITGSTRMKAGTAQKIILNMLSTAAMVKCGHVYENLMINLKPTNKKLRRRVISIVCEILKCDEERAIALLDANEWNIRRAVESAKA
ncbi:MAG: N-acetylmuramic acid 6-phosphate etherase [Clostridia bacterium]|nr:N-acetylmuramic acid 6-phosphate etherase [Clostridia bacterium]